RRSDATVSRPAVDQYKPTAPLTTKHPLFTLGRNPTQTIITYLIHHSLLKPRSRQLKPLRVSPTAFKATWRLHIVAPNTHSVTPFPVVILAHKKVGLIHVAQ